MKLAQLLTAFAGEIESLEAELLASLQTIGQSKDEDALLAAVQHYASLMQRWAEAAQTAELPAIAQLCTWAMENAMLLALPDMSADQRQAGLLCLSAWPARLASCLRQPEDASCASALAQHFCSAPQALSPEQALLLMYQLGQMGQAVQGAAASESDAASSAVQAESAESALSLDVPADLDVDLWQSFHQETPQQARQLTQILQALHNPKAEVPRTELRQQAQRLAHTIKGTGAIFGLRGISSVAHPLEDVLESMSGWTEEQWQKAQALLDLALDAAYCLEQMVAYVLGQDEAPRQAERIWRALLAAQAEQAQWDSSRGDFAPQAALPARPELHMDTGEHTVHDAGLGLPDAAASVRISQVQLEEIFRLSGQVRIAQTTQQGRLKKLGERVQELSVQDARWHQLLADLELALQQHGLQQVGGAGPKAGFDPLELDTYSALHDVLLSLKEAAHDKQLAGLRLQEDVQSWAQIQQRDAHVVQALQHEVLQTRMRSAASIRARVERTLHITAQSTGKHAQLRLHGETVRMDAGLLSSLMAPLMHMLRNAVDHGLEAPAERLAAGKPELGTVSLSFARLGSQVSLRCQDDGRGLDLRKVRQRAQELGLLPAGQNPSEQELARFIFATGFSTRSRANEISGRGVGLDVVHNWAASVGGSVDVLLDTQQPGLCIELRFPASLSMVPALLVRAGGQYFALPAVQIEQALAPGMGQLQQVDGQWRLQWQERSFPAYILAQQLGLPTAAAPEHGAWVLVQRQHSTIALAVDALLDAREWLVKDLGRFARHAKGATGVSILEDGGLAVHLDVAALIGHDGLNQRAPVLPEPSPLPRILVVDDSYSVRSSLRQLLQDAGYAVDSARDGLEAIAHLQAQGADILLTDLEMPNMNGAELTNYLRQHSPWQELPIIMISSRSHEKHRQLAAQAGVNAYLAKPYAELELLALIQDFLQKQCLKQ